MRVEIFRRPRRDDQYLPESRATCVRLTTGKVLRMLCDLHDLTQAQLAKRVGLSRSTISEIENDVRGVDIARARRLARALHAHPSTIADPNGTPRPR